MTAILAGFGDTVLDAQAAFRAVMDATSRPGRIQRITKIVAAPPPLSPAAAAIALTLADYDTPVWLDAPLAAADGVSDWLRFHTGAPVVADPSKAAFAFAADPERLPPFEDFALGTGEYPDRSTTIILQVASFDAGTRLELSGPGIAGAQSFAAAPLPHDLVRRLAANRALFPCGVDLLFASGDEIAALPRSTYVSGG